MAMTPSKLVPLGTKAPDFRLPDMLHDRWVSLQDVKSDVATVVMFICNHCPFVIHVQDELVALTNQYIQKGVAFVAINSNDVENYPQDAPPKMKETGKRLGYEFPYLFDQSQEIAQAYQATCTPDFFIYDKSLGLVYRGQLDDSRPGSSIPVSGRDIRNALDSLLAGKPVDSDQKASVGCNIKWKTS